MKFRSAQVDNFKSIENSTEFTVADVTCLVGKNESGKTALLEALEKLNPVVEARGTYDLIEDYPRRRKSEDEEKGIAQRAIVVRSRWELDDADVAELTTALGVDALTERSVGVTKGYENKRYWEIPLDEAKLAAHYLAEAKLSDDERTPLEASRSVEELLAALRVLQPPSEAQQALLTTLGQRFANPPQQVARETLAKRLPKFLYFHRYFELPGKVSIPDWISKKAALPDNYRVFQALLELVNKTPEAVRDMTKTEELIAELEAISSRISAQIFEYWTQNKQLRVYFRCEQGRAEDPAPFNQGYVFETRIWNDRHLVSLNFDERSTGFVWFFSFLVWFWQVKRHYGTNVFILLDEPALNLHARAQADLLRYINEKLRPEHQVMYTTHSPFLVDANNILSARTVEDVGTEEGKIEGTKVGDKVLSTDPDTVSPLQGALGYDITQTLFVGKHTLLVEGPSDLLYLTWASAELAKRGRTKLDPRWVISPAGGLGKIASFVTLFAGNNLHVAVLADYHQREKQKVRDFRESKLLRDGHVFTADALAGQAEADTEDILGRANYVALLNDAFALQGAQRMPDAKPADAPIRVVEEAERHFAVLPPEAPELDHYIPAEKLIADATRLGGVLPETEAALGRFEGLFTELNALLPKA
jgi:predicted ATP-dependent endonuclease of OLD family